jgi:hypothetical protein
MWINRLTEWNGVDHCLKRPSILSKSELQGSSQGLELMPNEAPGLTLTTQKSTLPTSCSLINDFFIAMLLGEKAARRV